MCEEESILLKLTFGDGSQDEREAESYDSCAVFDKQQEEAANKFTYPLALVRFSVKMVDLQMLF